MKEALSKKTETKTDFLKFREENTKPVKKK